MSKESKFIGYLVLGFGVLAIITVLILALGGADKKTTKTTKKETPVKEVVKLAPELLPSAPTAVPKKRKRRNRNCCSSVILILKPRK